MSCLEKLLIRGIRSFSPDEASVIEFGSPLTVIVGANGCGKTTIIECLKYATTGAVPPNSKQGFIHDLKVANERTIKAQVKLKFRNIKNSPMICMRSLQATQGPRKVTQKTLETVLSTRDPDTGEVCARYLRECVDRLLSK